MLQDHHHHRIKEPRVQILPRLLLKWGPAESRGGTPEQKAAAGYQRPVHRFQGFVGGIHQASWRELLDLVAVGFVVVPKRGG